MHAATMIDTRSSDTSPWQGLADVPARGFEPDLRSLHFDLPVRRGGYLWWYLDGLSADGQLGVTIIAFVGSVFSPYYARARRRMAAGGEPADPERHCALNVAIYRRGSGRGRDIWAFSEFVQATRDRARLQLGQSSIRWALDDRGPHLCVEIDDRTALLRRPLVGRVRLYPSALFGLRVALDRSERHRWLPIAPHARIEVELEQPALRFSGSGYHDVNEGDEGLEQAFSSWNWSRVELADDRSAILYDVIERDGSSRARGWSFSPRERTIATIPPEQLGPRVELPRTSWRVERSIRCDPDATPELVRTLEDTPFYSRNLVRTSLAGQRGVAMHESVSLDRFASSRVQFLLPFRIRRVRGQPALISP